MTKIDVLDMLVVFTGILFFILLLLCIGGKPYLGITAIDLLLMMLLMRYAHKAHIKHQKGRLNRYARERKFI